MLKTKLHSGIPLRTTNCWIAIHGKERLTFSAESKVCFARYIDVDETTQNIGLFAPLCLDGTETHWLVNILSILGLMNCFKSSGVIKKNTQFFLISHLSSLEDL